MTTPAPDTKLFLDTEFTGLHQHTTLISLALVADSGEEFYAEFTDYDRSQVDPWIEENVIKHLMLRKTEILSRAEGERLELQGDTATISEVLELWLQKFDSTIEIWSDVYAYDWVLFCELFGGAQSLPKNIFYIPFDLATAIRVVGLSPDINRVEIATQYWTELGGGRPPHIGPEHNALWDARVQFACYRWMQRAIERSKKVGSVLGLML